MRKRRKNWRFCKVTHEQVNEIQNHNTNYEDQKGIQTKTLSAAKFITNFVKDLNRHKKVSDS